MFIVDEAIEARCKWISARAALARIAPEYPHPLPAQERIIAQAAAGLVASRCVHMKGDASYGKPALRADDCLVSPEFWEKFESHGARDAEDWVAGDFTVAIYSQHNPKRLLRLHGVTFCEGDLDAVVPRQMQAETGGEPLDPPPANRRRFPALSDHLLAEWHALFLKAYPSGNATQAVASVTGMFPKHHISRKRIRALFPDIPVGRPLESED